MILRSIRFEIEQLYLGRFGIPHVFSWICQIFVGNWGPLKEKTKKSITSGPSSRILLEMPGKLAKNKKIREGQWAHAVNVLSSVNEVLSPIMAYIEDSCSTLFSNIIENDNHRLRELLPGANHPKYNLRRNRRFEIPRWRTNRFKNTFMMASTIKYNNSS